MQGAGRTETSSNQDRIGTRRGRIDAAWEKSKKEERDRSEDILSSKGNDRRIGKEEIEDRKEGEDLEEKVVKNEVSKKRRKRCEAEGMTELVAMATLSGERSPDGRA